MNTIIQSKISSSLNAIAHIQGKLLFLKLCHFSGSALVTKVFCTCIKFLDPVPFDRAKTLGIIVLEVSSSENSTLSNVL